jgi:hypothetical protein
MREVTEKWTAEGIPRRGKRRYACARGVLGGAQTAFGRTHIQRACARAAPYSLRASWWQRTPWAVGLGRDDERLDRDAMHARTQPCCCCCAAGAGGVGARLTRQREGAAF